MYRQSAKHARNNITFRLEIAGSEAIELKGTNALWAREWIMWHGKLAAVPWFYNRATSYLGFFVTTIKLRKCGAPDTSKLAKFTSLIDKLDETTEYKLWAYGELLESRPHPKSTGNEPALPQN
jgi:hypothetical protein